MIEPMTDAEIRTELPSRLHLVGAGGAGMSALAKILHGLGHDVTGSDIRAGGEIAVLADLGIPTWTGHRPEEAAAADLVVASSAVPDDDPELEAAARAGVEVWRRPSLLAALTAAVPTLGPTGTHGKTTTTAMLVTALRSMGKDPSFVIGGELVELATNAHLGTEPLLVLEIDEAFGTFEHLRLAGLVVTNVEAEHLDHFGTADELEAGFVRVVRSVDGPVVVCADDPGARRVAERTGAVTFGTDAGAAWRMVDPRVVGGGIAFELVGGGQSVQVRAPRPGLHIARDAAGALALLGELGHELAPAARGLASFRGVRRRFEHRGTVEGVTIIDDYAHHPTEVAATLVEAARLGAGRVWAVFQPHLYSRTRDLHVDMGTALAAADAVVVTDVYGSRENPIPGVTGELVVAAVERTGTPVHYLPHRGDVAAALAAMVEPGDLVVVMGAGDVTLVATELAATMATMAGRRR